MTNIEMVLKVRELENTFKGMTTKEIKDWAFEIWAIVGTRELKRSELSVRDAKGLIREYECGLYNK